MNRQARNGISKNGQMKEEGLSVHSEPETRGLHLWNCRTARGTSGAHQRESCPEALRTDQISSAGQTVCPAHPPRSSALQHKTLPTGRLTPFCSTDLRFCRQIASRFSSSSPGAREDGVDGPAADVLRVGEQVTVRVHRLRDRGVAQACLNHLGVEIGRDERRGVKVPVMANSA